MFLKDVLPLLKELDLKHIEALNKKQKLPKSKRPGERSALPAAKKPKQDPLLPVPALMDIATKPINVEEYPQGCIKSLQNINEHQEYFTSSYKKQSEMEVVGSRLIVPIAYTGANVTAPTLPGTAMGYYHSQNSSSLHAVNTFQNVNTGSNYAVWNSGAVFHTGPNQTGQMTPDSAGVDVASSTGGSSSIVRSDVRTIGANVLKFVTSQLEFKDKSNPISSSATGSCTRLKKSVEMTSLASSTPSDSNVIGSDVINLVKSQMASQSKDKDALMAMSISNVMGSSSQTKSKMSSASLGTGDTDCDVKQELPDESFLQAQQNIQMMIRGQFPMFSGKS
jgi:hypothetical protein